VFLRKKLYHCNTPYKQNSTIYMPIYVCVCGLRKSINTKSRMNGMRSNLKAMIGGVGGFLGSLRFFYYCIPQCYGARSFITVLTKPNHWTTCLFHSMCTHRVLQLTLILSRYPKRFLSCYCMSCQFHIDVVTLTILDEYIYEAPFY
jgi:hypothetical protein